MLCKLLILTTLTLTAMATETSTKAEPADTYAINFYVENDTRRMSLWGSDRNYTSGIKLSYLYSQGELPGWARRAGRLMPGLKRTLEDPQWSFNFGLSLGQQIYTPVAIARTDLIVEDQPYAGWLYLAALGHFRHGRNLHSIQVVVGVTGPPSLAEPTQKTFHRWIGVQQPMGWSHQLKTEPTLNVFYQWRRRVWEWNTSWGGRLIDVFPYAGGTLGNVYVYGGGGASARLGYQMSNDFGPAELSPVRLDPFLTYADELDGHPVEAYLFATAEVRGVVRNLFLDGNTFTDSHRIGKRFLVAEWEFGLCVRVQRLSIAWRQVARSPEIETNNLPHVYGSFSFTYAQRF